MKCNVCQQEAHSRCGSATMALQAGQRGGNNSFAPPARSGLVFAPKSRTTAFMDGKPSIVFDRRLLRVKRDRAAGSFPNHNFLKKEAAERLADRLSDITRSFPLALDLGCHCGELAQVMKDRGGVQTLIQADMSEAMVRQATGQRVVCDEEWLPFADNTFDAVFSVMSLHWVNDLPGTLVQIRRVLKPDGLFLAVLPGGQTLQELRESLLVTTLGIHGGAMAHVAPFIDVRDGGALLQRAGYALPVVDSDFITVTYRDAFKLMYDLRGMGETNMLHDQPRQMGRRDIMITAANDYQRNYEREEDKRIPATFELVFLTGWKPDASQPQPAKRGSGQVSLTKVLGDSGAN